MIAFNLEVGGNIEYRSIGKVHLGDEVVINNRRIDLVGDAVLCTRRRDELETTIANERIINRLQGAAEDAITRRDVEVQQ